MDDSKVNFLTMDNGLSHPPVETGPGLVGPLRFRPYVSVLPLPSARHQLSVTSV